MGYHDVHLAYECCSMFNTASTMVIIVIIIIIIKLLYIYFFFFYSVERAAQCTGRSAERVSCTHTRDK
jgi:hypothetical protein